MKDVECPYCGQYQEINHDDGYGYEEDRLHEQECADCENIFTFYTSIMFSYEPHKADCLNDGKHKFKPSCTAPKHHTKMNCIDCEESRPLTDKEWLDFMKPMEVISGHYY